MPETIIEIPVDQLVAHPDNEAKRSDISFCDDILESIEEHGQREPGRVRRVGDKFEILSGHRRATCCRFTGRDFRAIVIDADQTEATRELVLSNIRRDLDPIARAELIRTAINNGISREEVARLFGIGEAVVRQSLGLIELPKSLRDLVADGTLPVRYARFFIKFTTAEIASDRLAAEIRKNPHMREGLKPHIVAEWYKRQTRPVDKITRHCLHVSSGSHPRRFEIDEDTDAKLQIVTLPVGPGKKSIPVAQNTILWDRLQKQALAAMAPPADASPKPKPKASAAVDDNAEKQRQAETDAAADRTLEINLERWAVLMLRASIASNVADEESLIAYELGPTLLAWTGRESIRWLELSFRSLMELDDEDAHGLTLLHAKFAHAWGSDYVRRLFGVLVYPSADTGIDQPTEVVASGIPAAAALSDPEFDSLWVWIAERMHIDAEESWLAATSPATAERTLLERFVSMHNKRQRAALAAEWGFDKPDTVTRNDIVNRHLYADPLPIPKPLLNLTAGHTQ